MKAWRFVARTAAALLAITVISSLTLLLVIRSVWLMQSKTLVLRCAH
jgi:hypothetical protein